MTRPNLGGGALLVWLVTAGVAGLGSQQASTPAAQGPPKATPTTARRPPDVKSVVERIQRRINDEVTRPAAGHAAAPVADAGTGRKSAATLAPARRIHLVWRVDLVWPEALTQ